MPGSNTLVLLAALTFGVLSPAVAQAAVAPVAERSTVRSATCHRTLAHYPVLHPGDRSSAVRTLQCVLNDDGYGPVVVDGFYGPQTRAAVTAVEDGFEGPSAHPGRIDGGFWVLLLSRHLPERTLRLGQHGSAVTTLQRSLRAAGSTIVVDGSFGPQTKRVVQAYQRALSLPATGIVGERTRFLLVMGAAL